MSAGDVGSTVKVISEVLRRKAIQWCQQLRLVEPDALRGTQPVETGRHFSYVVQAPKSSDKMEHYLSLGSMNAYPKLI